MDWTWLAVFAAVALTLTYLFRRSEKPEPPAKYHAGNITAETLIYYSGYDYAKPILLAIKGKVYDVTKSADQFGPGKPLHVYAGKEVARALALGSTSEDDIGSDATHDLDAAAAQRLAEKVAEFESKYDMVGQVVPLREMSLEELLTHDGSDPSKPLLLAIRGVVFDVSKGKQFYGPDGVYPFAGRECARALALISTQVSDCNDNLGDLGYSEMENLREWEAKFSYKYPIVGKVVAKAAK